MVPFADTKSSAMDFRQIGSGAAARMAVVFWAVHKSTGSGGAAGSDGVRARSVSDARSQPT